MGQDYVCPVKMFKVGLLHYFMAELINNNTAQSCILLVLYISELHLKKKRIFLMHGVAVVKRLRTIALCKCHSCTWWPAWLKFHPGHRIFLISCQFMNILLCSIICIYVGEQTPEGESTEWMVLKNRTNIFCYGKHLPTDTQSEDLCKRQVNWFGLPCSYPTQLFATWNRHFKLRYSVTCFENL